MSVRRDASYTCSDRYTKKVIENIFCEKLLVNLTIIYKETVFCNVNLPNHTLMGSVSAHVV